MRIHFIAIGGSAMHNLALALHKTGKYTITGSDDEIYEPSLSRLKAAGLCPTTFGWYPDQINESLDAVILGMHAKADNPELLKAQELGLPIYSYPEFIFQHSKDKKRVVIAGSHGKTTTTSIIMHVLKSLEVDFDYLVGSQIEGFDTMVRLSDAPLLIIEGDEYLSSPIDRRPKIHHYKPHLSVITGIAWDHINVFPTFDNYIEQFRLFLDLHEEGATVIYYENDSNLVDIVTHQDKVKAIAYDSFALDADQDKILYNGSRYTFPMVGQHNLQNAKAAFDICQQLGISETAFFDCLATFKGAAKRLQVLADNGKKKVFLDFAHAPSKLMSTTNAVKKWYTKPLTAVFELHTFSSLNEEFLPQYKHCLDAADEAVVYYDARTLTMKNRPPLDPAFVQSCFGNTQVKVIHSRDAMHQYLDELTQRQEGIILLMSSGTFGQYDLNKFKA